MIDFEPPPSHQVELFLAFYELTWLDSVGSKKALTRLDGGHGWERYSWW